MSQPIGIDFGTTNSVVATYAGGGVDVLPIDEPPLDWADLGFAKVFPSVIGVAGGNRATFGWQAKQQGSDKLEAVKRLFATEDSVRIGGIDVSVELAAAALFGQLRGGAEANGVTVTRAVVTIPANSRGLARSRTKVCAGLAGIEVAALINEPTAAAMAHSISAAEDQTILVFDWGGGTLDVTVLETVAGVFMERASKGIQRSGGIDLDNLFAGRLLQQVEGHEAWGEADRGRFRLDVERAKVVLSEPDREEVNLVLPGGRPLTARRGDLEAAIRPKVDETGGPIDQCLRDLRIDAAAIDHVVMVGGSSKIPLVRRFVAEKLGKDPVGGVDPMTAVAEGAAIAAAVLADQLDADFFVATEHALGTIALDTAEREMAFSVLIPRNHSLPAKARGTYAPVNDNQESVAIEVIEGDPEVGLDHPDNVILKHWSVPIDSSRTIADAAFDIEYTYDVEGILHVKVTDNKTGADLLRDDVTFGASGDKAGLVRTAKQLREMLESGLFSGDPVVSPNGGSAPSPAGASLDPESVRLIERTRTKVIPFIDEVEAQRLEAMCLDLENATGDAVAAQRETLGSECRQYAYLYA